MSGAFISKRWILVFLFLMAGCRTTLSSLKEMPIGSYPEAFEKEGFFTLKGHTDSVYSVAFTNDGKTLVSASRDRTIRIWDLSTGTSKVLRTEKGAVFSMILTPDGKTLAYTIGGAGNNLRLWDYQTDTEPTILPTQASDVRISADGKTLVSRGLDGITIKIWDMATNSLRHNLEFPSQLYLSLAFSPTGTLAIGDQFWNTKTGRDEESYFEKQTNYERRPLKAAAFSPDGASLALGVANAFKDGIWILGPDAKRSSKLDRLKTLAGSLPDSQSDISALAYSLDGKTLVSASEGGTVSIWDLDRLTALKTIREHSDRIVDLKFSPDGRAFATSSWDNTIKIWNYKYALPSL